VPSQGCFILKFLDFSKPYAAIVSADKSYEKARNYEKLLFGLLGEALKRQRWKIEA
jgi:hypothetical protein